MEMFFKELSLTVVYGILSLTLMFIGYKFFDLITPFKFADEIKEKNGAMGAVIAGIFIATAIIIKATIVS